MAKNLSEKTLVDICFNHFERIGKYFNIFIFHLGSPLLRPLYFKMDIMHSSIDIFGI